MTPETCPACRVRLRPGACFCTQCGGEVRPPCPSCGGAPRPLATMSDGCATQQPWCEACEALLYACEQCGRWLLPGSPVCPDPQCASRSLPVLPQHTGRRWDARGIAVGWTWPPTWDRAHPEFHAPVAEEWPCEEPLHTAFVAHGSLFVWAGNSLLSPDPVLGWIRVDEAGRPLTAPPAGGAGAIAGAAWQCPLGSAGTPAAGVPFIERAAVAGACAVLAMERCYVQVGLRHRGDTYALGGGSPLAHVAGPAWWAGWSHAAQGSRAPQLRIARVQPTADLSHPRVISLPPEAVLAESGRMALRDDTVYWPTAGGAVWRLHCGSGEARAVTDPEDGFLWTWAPEGGYRLVRERRGQVYLTLTGPEEGHAAPGAPVGAGPLRGVFDHPELVVVAADRLIAFHPRTGERLCEALRPPGRWVDGVLATAPDGEPRFLALTVEGGFATLTAVRMSSGAQDLLWRQIDVEPRALLPVGNDLYIAHTRGVVRLRMEA